MKTYKVIIVEDEEPARNLEKHFIQKHPDLEIIVECTDGFMAVKNINELKPDLVFLDIQLPKLTGMEVLELIEHKPVIIFSTAYDQFAIQAFEKNAVDYLLKPYSESRFNIAIEKARLALLNNAEKNNTLQNLSNDFDEKAGRIDRVVVKTGSKIKVVPVESIHYIESQDDYVMIYSAEGKHLKEKTMKFFETHLPQNDFVRIHRSYIININQILKIEPFEKEGYIAVLKDQARLKISASGFKRLKEILSF